MRSSEAKTKIVCTLGPSTSEVDILVHLAEAGADVVRLNFSHGTHDDHAHALRNAREAARRVGAPLAVLQDLQGPKIRIGELSSPSVELAAGTRFVITAEDIVGTRERVSTSFRQITQDVKEGDPILIDDGRLRLRVAGVRGKEVICTVEVGGTLLPHKGINLPGVPVSAPSLTPKDVDDLEFGLENDVDYVALSFVRSAADVQDLRKIIAARLGHGRLLPVIAKIEKPQAVENIDAIIAESDGIMVARGDLGVEMPAEEVPMLQKMIIAKCTAAGKPVIVATQMLESMVNNPAPTRAETSDVANAVIDGCDAVMLSGETSIGKYPVEAVRTMDRIVRKVEEVRAGQPRVFERPPARVENRHEALGRAACVLADQMRAAALVAVTHTGQTARALSRHRPRIPIIGVTDSGKALRLLSLIWGVRGLLVENLNEDSDRALQRIQDRLVSEGVARRGEYVVLLAGQPFFAGGSTNFIKVEKVT